MNELFRTLVAQSRDFYKTLSPVKRVSMLATIVVAVIGLFVLVVVLSGKDQVPLLTNIPPDQVGEVVDLLQRKNIPYRIADGGSTVLVAKGLLHSSQMSLMSEIGDGKIGDIGLELFDKQDFGQTSYAQRVNYQRALQGELMRAINSLDVVKRSKVILALPPKKTFLEEGGNAKASVVVDLLPGKGLNQDQIRGITYLVANAVEDLEPEYVSVIDAKGRVLSKRGNPNMAGSSELMELQKKIEMGLEEEVETALTRLVGEGKVIVRVNASLNPQKVSMMQELIDPDKTAIRSIQTEEESLNGNRSNPTGVPGARANLPGAADAGNVAFNQDVKKELKTTNYDVPKTRKNVVEAAGKLERLSIAVVVDGTTSEVEGEGGEVSTQWTPRSQEELVKFENIVKNTIGFNAQRGDSFKIESLQFKGEDFRESERVLKTLHRERLLRFLATWGLALFGLGLLYLVVIRPFMRWITDSFQDSVEDMLPRTIEELEDLQSVDNTLPGMSNALPILEESLDPDKAESELLKERIMKIMENDQEKAAGAFSLWLVRRDY